MADIRSLLDSAATYDPNYVYGALLPMRKNKKTKDVELALPGIFKDMAQAVTSPMRALEGKIDPMSPEAVTEAANIAGLLGGSSVAATGTRRMPKGQVNHTVWHGSPHKFDKFDMSKIGTGEGAQAYGHGLYFAESPKVAQTYADSLGATQFYANGVPLSGDSAWAAMHMADNGGNVKGILDWAKSSLKPTPEGRKAAASLVREARKLRGKEITEADGQVYKVDIPDEILPRMLDWDKPLSQQPEVMKKLLQNDSDWNSYAQQLDPKSRAIAEDMVLGKKPKLGDDSTNYWNALYKKYPNLDHNAIHDVADKFNPKTDDADWLMQIMNGGGAVGSGVRGGGGADFYNSLGGGDVASSQLKALGIPGIRYLDGNSRGTGGTSNFVLFDDRLPRIIERNGVPTGLRPWKDDPEALRGLLGAN